MLISIFSALAIFSLYKYGIRHVYTLSLVELAIMTAFKEKALTPGKFIILSSILIFNIVCLYKDIPYRDFTTFVLIGIFMIIGGYEEWKA